MVRCSSRCASSNLPLARKSASRVISSALMPFIACCKRRARRHIMRIGIDLDRVQLARLVAGQGIELGDAVHHIAEQLHPPGAVFIMGREDVDGVAPHPEGAAGEIVVVAPVLQRHQPADGGVAVDLVAFADRDGGAGIGLDRADAVDARHRGHDDHIVALQDRPRRRMAHAVDLFVDRAVLLDIGVGARDIGFRLVVIVIADEIFHRVFREELLELGIELRRQGLVGGQDQSAGAGSSRSPAPW